MEASRPHPRKKNISLKKWKDIDIEPIPGSSGIDSTIFPFSIHKYT